MLTINSDFIIDKNNKIFCTINGIVSTEFKIKNVNNRTIAQSKMYSLNSDFNKNIISLINEIDKSTRGINCSESILLNFWNLNIYETHENALMRGSKLTAEGVIGFKVYNRVYGDKRLHLFFSTNKVLKIETPKPKQLIPILNN